MYNQDLDQQFHDFNTSVAMLINVLKLQDKDLLKICKESLFYQLGEEETTHMFNAAMFQLAETFPEACYWTWHNFPELQVCMDLKEHVCTFTVQKLISKGFILGKDFSTNIDGTILMRPDVRIALMLDCVPSEWKFVKSVVQIVK
jgi:hypothetical protein